MKKRNSSTLDESDYENAHNALLTDATIDWPSQLIGYLLVLAGGGLISWGVGYFPEGNGLADFASGIALAISGLMLGGVGIFVHVRRR